MVKDHPFQLLFETFGRLPASNAETVNRKAYEELLSVLDVPADSQGRCILLRAPRAGHGKTHLLTRVQHQFAGNHEFIPLHPAGGQMGAASVTEDALKRLTRALPAAGGLTVLDLVVRRLFSFALQPLVVSGEVPCQDREGALSALRNRPAETFDFHHPNAVTARWAKENFEVLGPRLAMELAQRSGHPLREVSYWVDLFFRYAATPLDHPGRAGVLVAETGAEAISEGAAMERLVSLLALLTLLMRVVLVADDLEGFSADETAALKFAAFMGSIRQSAERVDVILSLNKDIWENAFVPRLSGGLADRLSEVLIELEPLSDEDIIALFDSRAPGLGQQVLERVDVSERHARGLIRAAGSAWVKALNEKDVAPSASVQAFVEEPVQADEAAEEEIPSTADAFVKEEAPVDPESLADADDGFSFDPVLQPSVPEEPAVEETPEEVAPLVAGEEGAEIISPESRPAAAWGGGSIFDAEVIDGPPRVEPFTSGEVPHDVESQSFTSEAVPQYVESQPGPAEVEQAAVFEPQLEKEKEAPVFPPMSPMVGFGPPPPPPPTPKQQPIVEEDDRVDDLLKQFRDRYGR